VPESGEAEAAMARKQPSGSILREFLSKVRPDQTALPYRKKQLIYAQGDPADAVFYVQKGRIKLTVVSPRGKAAVVAMVGPGEFFAEGCLAGQPLRTASAVAMTEATLIRIERRAMVAALHGPSALTELFMAHLLSRTARMEEDLVDRLFNSNEKRLARVLLMLAHFGKEGKTEPVLPKISQETLAEMIGTTRSRVNGFMNKFRKLGFIEYNGGLHVHSSLMNLLLHS
jgi:CRP/FNR family cyclic AMP-dependent transcriptional regulator